MCPFCVMTTVLVVAGTTSAGGLTALAVKKLCSKSKAQESPEEAKPKEEEAS